VKSGGQQLHSRMPLLRAHRQTTDTSPLRTKEPSNWVRAARFAVLVVLGLLSAGVAAADLPPSSPDSSFGSSGEVMTLVPMNTGPNTSFNTGTEVDGLVTQPAGGLLVTGVDADGLVVVRYNRNGSLNPRFGVGGVVTTPVATLSFGSPQPLVQPDGKIVVAGTTIAQHGSGLNVGTFGVVLVRYNANGTLDSSFGSDGRVRSPIAMGVNALSLQADGKLVVAGESEDDPYTHYVRLVRYTADGSLDRGFGQRGVVTVSASATNAGVDSANALAVLPDGKLIVAGSTAQACPRGSVPSCTDDQLMLARLTSAGALDQSFGDGGIVRTPIAPFNADGASIAMQPTGRILIAGDLHDHSNGVQKTLGSVLARYDADGSLDSGFGDGGITTTMGLDRGSAPLSEADGTMIVTGLDKGLVLARYSANGSLETATHLAAPFANAYCCQSAIDPDGKLVLAGDSQNGANPFLELITVVRYNLGGASGGTHKSLPSAGKPRLTQFEVTPASMVSAHVGAARVRYVVSTKNVVMALAIAQKYLGYQARGTCLSPGWGSWYPSAPRCTYWNWAKKSIEVASRTAGPHSIPLSALFPGHHPAAGEYRISIGFSGVVRALRTATFTVTP